MDITWEAIYEDGTAHTEDELGSTDSVDRSKLREFRLSKDGAIFFRAFFDISRKLIFRRRHIMAMDGSQLDTVYLVGWHANVNGTSVKSICYIHSDGTVEFDDARSNLELTQKEL